MLRGNGFSLRGVAAGLHRNGAAQRRGPGVPAENSSRGITCSMSRRGNCYDNAVVESWFKTLKAELGSRFDNHGHAKEEVFDYIEVFYNQQRRHSAIGYISPAEYERAAAMRQAA